MKKFICVFLLCILCFPLNTYAMDISAQSAVVIDKEYGNVLYEKNAHQRLPMASTTKIMTAICAIEEGNLDKKIKISDTAVGVEGSSIYLTKGESLTLRELVYGLMLNSGNDAAVAIACALSGSVEEFAKIMNEKAQKIGVKNTSFANPNGLDEEGHYTTAYDLAKITAYAMKNEDFRTIASTYQTTIDGPEGKRYLTNHNKLLKRMEGCIGVKTGFTKKSGRCLVSACERDGVEVVTVTLNAPDDWNDHIKMTDYAYTTLTKKPVARKSEKFGIVKIEKGTKEELELVSPETFYVPMKNDIKYVSVYECPSAVTAPIKKGDEIATLKVYMGDANIETFPVVAAEDVPLDTSRSIVKSIYALIEIFAGI